MARTFGCEVHAFDPSPVSMQWWNSKSSAGVRALSNYHFHPYGASGYNGKLELSDYDWGQVSIIRYEDYFADCGPRDGINPDPNSPCQLKHGPAVQSRFSLDVKTLPTI